MKFTPDIKFVNDETLNEFIVTVERRDVGEIDVKNDRDSDRDDREDKDREDRDKTLENSNLENNQDAKRDREDRDDVIEMQHISYKSLSGVQKDVIQFCSIPRSARAYNSTNIANQIKPLLEHGFIEMTEPEKPNSKNQKYRKVRKE